LADLPCSWDDYAHLQAALLRGCQITDRTWGLEEALNRVLASLQDNKPLKSDEIARAVIHEIGHKVGMVTDGTGKKPDMIPTHYVDRGHVGPHCHNGLPLLDSYSGVSTGNICVMFGTITDQVAFCPDCAKAVKKMDLAAGWPPA